MPRSIDVGPLTLSVEEAGAGGHPLLLLHGFTGAGDDFVDWVQPLADLGFHVAVPDLRGHGASDKPDAEEHYSVATFTDDVLGLLDALGWDRFALLGHSMGGMVAQDVALRVPERVERLVLMDTHHGAVPGVDPAMREFGASIVRDQGMTGLLEVLDAVDDPTSGTEADRRLRAERPGYVEFGRRKMLDSAPAMWLAMSAELLGRPDRLPELATLPMPTLVIVGDQDSPFLKAAHRMAATIPGARLVEIPDAGHSPQFENPEPWWAALQVFLTAPS